MKYEYYKWYSTRNRLVADYSMNIPLKIGHSYFGFYFLESNGEFAISVGSTGFSDGNTDMKHWAAEQLLTDKKKIAKLWKAAAKDGQKAIKLIFSK